MLFVSLRIFLLNGMSHNFVSMYIFNSFLLHTVFILQIFNKNTFVCFTFIFAHKHYFMHVEMTQFLHGLFFFKKKKVWDVYVCVYMHLYMHTSSAMTTSPLSNCALKL